LSWPDCTPSGGDAAAPADLKYGVVTTNELRTERGLRPGPWGDVAWLALNSGRTDEPRAKEQPRMRREAENKAGVTISNRSGGHD
jgi:hypothetical protein